MLATSLQLEENGKRKIWKEEDSTMKIKGNFIILTDVGKIHVRTLFWGFYTV